MDKYNQLVRHIAEEMSKEMHPVKAAAGFTYEQLADHYTPVARIAVMHMAESYMSGNTCGRDGDDHEDCFNEMRKRGLIPSPEKATDND